MKVLLKTRLIFYLAVFSFAAVMAAQAADPVVVEVHYQNGVKFLKRGLYERSIKEFEKTLSLDPEHVEAKEHLENARSLKEKQTRVEVRKSVTAELQGLYSEGKRLYACRDYRGAREVFDKILEQKRIDDVASVYKERCEIFLSRELEQERRIGEKNKLKERRQKEKEDRRSAAQVKKEERRAMLEKRKDIDGRRRQAKEEKIAQMLEAESSARSQGFGSLEKETATKDAKQAFREEGREQKIPVAQERRDAQQKIREEKIAAAEKRKEEKRALKEEKKAFKKNKKGRAGEEKIEEVEATPEILRNKQFFLKGVGEYGRKEYEAAIASFEAVIQAESGSRKLYTHSAKRLMEKTKKKLEAAREK